MRSVYKVAIVGGGTMGLDLAALVARQDMPVVVKEVNDALAGRVREKFDQRVGGWLAKGKINESRAEQLKMLFSVTSSYDGLKDADLVIEAVPENLELKKKIFEDLSRSLPNAILTSNTSSLPIGILTERVLNPDRMAGLHFFNPPTRMPLVELISSESTSQETLESLEVFTLETLAKTPIRVKDRPGFLVNVLLGAYLAPAIMAVEKTNISLSDIDDGARKFGWPMGPFTLLDMLGVDVAHEVTKILVNAYGDRFIPSSLLAHMVAAGLLGQKSGEGFYGDKFPELLKREFPRPIAGDAKTVFRDMMYSMVNEAAIALQDDVSSANDIETGCLLGLGFPQGKGGPLHYADEIGLANVVEILGDRSCNLLRDKAKEGSTFFESL
ncbi:MAG: 3-hydroxyacyl-CoA dehydrogenase NAD-binding domain-containing protein [bacterium]|nr:3-hydroxyacyl-CoA dehydrogenase NAD-binding domain-containing protein [bacterium]